MGFSVLAPSYPISRCLPSGHANTEQLFPASGRRCWRRLPCKAFVLRRGTPTRSSFFRLVGAGVGVVLPVKPLFSVGARQHALTFPGESAAVLASFSPLTLYLPSGHANTAQIFQIGWLPRMKKPASGKQLSLTMSKSVLGGASQAGTSGGSAMCHLAAA